MSVIKCSDIVQKYASKDLVVVKPVKNKMYFATFVVGSVKTSAAFNNDILILEFLKIVVRCF